MVILDSICVIYVVYVELLRKSFSLYIRTEEPNISMRTVEESIS